MLEHVTHEVTIAALPTEIPEASPPTSPGWRSATRFSSSALIAPEGVEFVLGEDQSADEITIATLSPPRVEEEPEPELEEEAELVGEEGEAIEGEEAAAEGEAATASAGERAPATPATRSRSLRLFGRRWRERRSTRGRSAGERDPRRRPRQPGQPLRRTRHNVGFEVARRARAPLGAAEGEGNATAA